jgi:hypothetical protein
LCHNAVLHAGPVLVAEWGKIAAVPQQGEDT